MKTAISYEASNASREKIMEAFPHYKTLLSEFHNKGKLLAVGEFANPQKDGSMGIFKTREFAEEFVKQDPFVLEELVGQVTI